MSKKPFFMLLLAAPLFAACAGSGVRRIDLQATAQPGKTLIGTPVTGSDWLGTPFVFRKGETIPIRARLRTPFLELKDNTITLSVKEDIYILFTLPGDGVTQYKKAPDTQKKALLQKMQVLLSSDGRTWAPFNSARALKKVFGIQNGSVSVGFSVSRASGLLTFLSLSTR